MENLRIALTAISRMSSAAFFVMFRQFKDGSAFRRSEKDLTGLWEAVNNDMVVKVYSPVHLRDQTKGQTV